MRSQFLSSERGKNVNQPSRFRNLPRFQPPLQPRFSAKPGLIALSRGVGQTPVYRPLHHSANGQQSNWSHVRLRMMHLRVKVWAQPMTASRSTDFTKLCFSLIQIARYPV